MKMKRLLLIVGIGIVLAAAIAFFMWNKPDDKAEDHEGISVAAATLCKDYTADEAKANTQYLSKVLEVTGTVTEATTSQDGAVVIKLQGDEDKTVQCTMRDKDVKAAAGQQLTIKGFCSGSTMFDVLLTDCIVK